MSEFILVLGLLFILTSLFIVLLERKMLAHAQRRMGPSVMGRNGWMQIILDLMKLIGKESYILPKTTTALVPFLLASFYATQLWFSVNFVFSPQASVFTNVEALFFLHIIFILIGNIMLLLVGFTTYSKYTLIAIVRAIVHVVSMDIAVSLVYTLLILVFQSANFADFAQFQTQLWVATLFCPVSSLFLIILLLEAKRSPFDHVETESEVVAGYATEYSGVMLLIFYLIEYLHLAIASIHFVVCFLGSWSLISVYNALLPAFLVPHTSLGFTFFFLF